MGADHQERQVLIVNDGVIYPPTQEIRDFNYWWNRFTAGCIYYANPKNSVVLLLCLAVILIGTTNRVMFKKMLIPMGNYPFFLSQLTSFIYLPVFWPAVYFLMFFTNTITPEMREFPGYKFAIMGLLDASAGLLMTFGGTHTSGPMQLLLTQAAIPFTMFFTIIVSMESLDFLFRRVLQVNYKWNHYSGAGVLIVGIIISLAGQFLNKSPNNGSSTWYGLVIFFSNNLPTGFSGVYKEIAFKGEARLDIFYVNAWVATWQFFLGMLFLPTTTIPGFGGLAFDEIPGNLWGGAKCVFGINTLPTDHCAGAIWDVGGYMLANIAYNIVILLTIKYGSAALLYVCSAVILPLADICFSSTAIMGQGNAIPLTLWDWAGLAVILLGLLLYRLKEESDEAPKELQDPAQAPLEIDGDQEEVLPIIMIGGATDLILTAKRRVAPLESRTVTNIRHHYLSRLGINEMPRKVAQNTGAL